MRRSRGSAAILAASAVVVMISGCGSSDAESPASTSSSSATPARSALTAAERKALRAQDRKAARSAVANINDMPNEWTTLDGSVKNEAAAKSPCKYLESAKRQLNARGASKTFVLGEETTFSHALYVYENDEMAARVFNELTSTRSLRCMARSLFADANAENKDPATVIVDDTFAEIKVPTFGDRTRASRLTARITFHGRPMTRMFDSVFVRSGRKIIIGDFYHAQPQDRNAVMRATIKSVGDVPEPGNP